MIPSNGELLESIGRFEQLLAVDVRVARDGREVRVAEVLGDEPRVAELLAEPGRGGVAEGVRGDVLLDPGALAARPMMSARIVCCSRPPWSPQKTGLAGPGLWALANRCS